MEERVALAGGLFEIVTAPGQGAAMLATFPLPHSGTDTT
jgi:signal transduction histidine kinase